MPLFLKTARSVCKFCQQLALEGTKLIKLGIFQELDTVYLRLVPSVFSILLVFGSSNAGSLKKNM